MKEHVQADSKAPNCFPESGVVNMAMRPFQRSLCSVSHCVRVGREVLDNTGEEREAQKKFSQVALLGLRQLCLYQLYILQIIYIINKNHRKIVLRKCTEVFVRRERGTLEQAGWGMEKSV